MVTELVADDRYKVLPLIINSNHELTIKSVIAGNSPGNVYVDNINNPQSGLVKTPECNVIFGNSSNSEFNQEIKKHIGYFDPITCDTSDWNAFVENKHSNSAIRKYQRKYFEIEKQNYDAQMGSEKATAELIYLSSLNSLSYENKEIITEWLEFEAIERFNGLCLAAIVVINNTIVSMSAVDCFVDNKIEIGVKTMDGFKRKGYAKSVVAAMINESFKNGIEKIGWHCVSTNRGSIKIAESCGFQHVLTYESYSPYPPIENTGDLSTDQWREYAQFFEERAAGNANHYWQASKCWAKAINLPNAIKCIQKLLDNKIYWFIEYLPGSEEFEIFENDNEWTKIKDSLKSLDI